MKQTVLKVSVVEAVELVKKSLQDKGFTVFAEVDHQANAASVDLEMPASCALIFGNPIAGTKLMQKDIFMSLDLPLRLAIIEKDGQVMLIHQTTEDYVGCYQVANHPVLEKIEGLFAALVSELS